MERLVDVGTRRNKRYLAELKVFDYTNSHVISRTIFINLSQG